MLRFVQLVISEIDSSAATSLQAVKLLALYLTGDKVSALDLTYVASDLLPDCALRVWIWVVELGDRCGSRVRSVTAILRVV